MMFVKKTTNQASNIKTRQFYSIKAK